MEAVHCNLQPILAGGSLFFSGTREGHRCVQLQGQEVLVLCESMVSACINSGWLPPSMAAKIT